MRVIFAYLICGGANDGSLSRIAGAASECGTVCIGLIAGMTFVVS